jgi:DNA-binding NarL/FixJ family response regulator
VDQPGATGRVLIADDHPLFRAALRQVVEATLPGSDICEANNLAEAEAVFAAGECDLVLLDINMPGMNGFNGLIHLRNTVPATPIVVVSADESIETIRQAMTLGAWGFIPKSMDGADMGTAVKRVLAGEIFVPVDLANAVPGHDDGVDEAFRKGYAALTAQQRKVLEMMVLGKSNKVIAYEMDVVEGTVKSHVSAILHKLKVNSRIQAVLNASKLMGRSRGG